jgi:release factor glutamine methyltransferase
MLPEDCRTILGLLRWASDYLKTHQIEQPRTSAEILLGHTLGLARADLYVQYDRPLQPEELRRFKMFISRRLQREPVAYIIGEKGFWSLDLKVTRDVLIPRPETEILVETALSIIPPESRGRPLRILDLGTGSGAVVLALAKERPGHKYVGVDISRKAIDIARTNARDHELEDSIAFLCGSWFHPMGRQKASFDVVVANPPYVGRKELEALSPDISEYEPLLALDGGPDGLAALRIIIMEAPGYIHRGGWLLLEIGHGQRVGVERLFLESDAYCDISVVRDYGGIDRVIRAKARKGQIF